MELLSYKNITIKEKLTIEDFLNDCIIINIDDKIKLNETSRQYYSGYSNSFKITTYNFG
jgi:hypothetical protein